MYRSRFFHDAWRVFDVPIVGIAVMPATGVFSVLRALRREVAGLRGRLQT